MKESLARLSPIEPSRLSDRVAAQLRRQIVQGVYAPGAKLPPASELAAALGVTRLTVREALAQLEAAGLTRTRHGSGTYVMEPAEHATLQTLTEMLSAGRDLTPAEIGNLLEFRAVVIRGFADRVVTSRQAVHLELLRNLVAEERAVLGQHSLLAALDYRFNEALAVASGNLFYTLLLRSLRRAHEYLGEIVFRHSGDGRVIVETHQSIVSALEKGDARAVRRRIELYLEGGEQLVNDWLKTSSRSGGRP